MAVTSSLLSRASLRDSVQYSVKNFIIDNQLRPGDLLPPEAKLAHQLGVSRSSLREAIRALQILGVVESRHGSGTYVGSFDMATLQESLTFSIRISSDSDALLALREVLEVRSVLERHMIREIAATCSDDQLAQLEEITHQMAIKAKAGLTFAEEDIAFHEALYAGLGNSLFVQLVRTFWQVFARVESHLRSIDQELHMVVETHQRIGEALRNRDPDAAEVAMAQHLEGIHERVNNVDWA